MRILFVAMSNSVHTSRWVSQITDQGWDLHLFPSYEVHSVHPGLKSVTVHEASGYRAAHLAALIDELRPDLIHSLEFQGAGYLTLAAKALTKQPFPKWVVTSWGSDIYYFGRFPEHEPKIRAVLSTADAFMTECERDVKLAKQFGFTGEVLPILPGAGGFDLKRLEALRSKTTPSQRRLIMLKGYQGWAGRANVGLLALWRVRRQLTGYRVVLFSSQLVSRLAGRLFQLLSGVPLQIVPHGTSHDELLRLHGRARLSIGLSITDGVPNAMLEAMAMGSLPIQSVTSCADEWLTDGQTGLLVPAEDVQAIAAALSKGLTDDKLVDEAAEKNAAVVAQRLDAEKLKPQVVAVYRKLA